MIEPTPQQPDADPPKPTLKVGQDRAGRFVKGNKLASMQMPRQKCARWRWAFYRAVSPADVRAVVKQLVKAAKAGESWAVKEFLDRALGRTPETMELRSERDEIATGQPAHVTWATLIQQIGTLKLPLPPGLPQPDKLLSRLGAMRHADAGGNGDQEGAGNGS